jgi:hypothetical protein
VTVAAPTDVGLATLVADTVTVAGLGTSTGAVCRPFEEMVPHVSPLQPPPATVLFTAVLGVFVTEAVNCWVLPPMTCAVVGDTVTTTAGAPVPVTGIEITLEIAPPPESLVMRILPLTWAISVGAKVTLTTCVWVGFKIKGKVAPETERPTPVGRMLVTCTGKTPVEVNVMVCEASLNSSTLPKAKLVALTASPGTDAVSWTLALLENPPEVAVNTTSCGVCTANIVPANCALVWPLGIERPLGI